jgi:glutamine---fructose-6-phosphate transaminase (isomerizing)
VMGVGQGEMFLASDVPALLPYTRDMIFLHDGDMVVLNDSSYRIMDLQGNTQKRDVTYIEWDAEAAEKGGFDTYMLKEIFEQPQALTNTLLGRLHDATGEVDLELNLDPASFKRISIIACGTAFYAGLVGEYLIEQLARIPVEVDVASEYRYRQPLVSENTLAIVISQSGETIDTLEALREAKKFGAKTLGVINAKGSSMTREVDDTLYIHAGPEIGVASTKAYTSMVSAMLMLALWLGRARGTLDANTGAELLRGARELPRLVEEALNETRVAQIKHIAEKYKDAKDYLFLGRGVNSPTAFEGALKLKEISYIHAEAYAAGEMKHGPIALIDETLPVIVIATESFLLEKTISNIQEVRARGGKVIAVVSDGDTDASRHADDVIIMPKAHEMVSPVVNAVAMQLLAYFTATALEKDVDKPRNLAKSVTVE